MADTEIVVQAQSTAFERFGNARQTKDYSLPFSLRAFIDFAYTTSAPAGDLSHNEQVFLNNLFLQDPQCLPGGTTLATIQALVAELFDGASDLQQIYQKDPFSTEYELATTELYNRVFLKARSTAQSGPVNVRGGTARMGFELAELDTLQSINRFREIWQNQVTVAQLVTSAVQVANVIEQGRRETMLRAQQQQAATEQGRVQQMLAAGEVLESLRANHIRTLAAGGEFTGVPIMIQQEDLQGQGFQQGVTTSFGASYWR